MWNACTRPRRSVSPAETCWTVVDPTLRSKERSPRGGSCPAPSSPQPGTQSPLRPARDESSVACDAQGAVAVSSTSVHPQETNVDSPMTSTEGVAQTPLSPSMAFRHSGWRHDRDLVRLALESTGTSRGRLSRWDQCGENAWVLRHPEQANRYRIAASYCHDRFCRPCSNARSNLAAMNLLSRLGGAQHRFVTLTLKSTTESLCSLVDKLYKSFRRLRSHTLWQQKVDGGAAFLEIKWNQNRQRWHPHLHLIVEGRYLPKELLRSAWHKVTGNSFIVDIKLIHSKEHTARYVAKYASKPLSSTFLNRPDRLEEAIVALRGTRLALTFGTWRGFRLFQHGPREDWIAVAPLVELLELAAAGHELALSIMRSFECNQTSHLPPSRGHPTAQTLSRSLSPSVAPAPHTVPDADVNSTTPPRPSATASPGVRPAVVPRTTTLSASP
jgi:hypothetical protein